MRWALLGLLLVAGAACQDPVGGAAVRARVVRMAPPLARERPAPGGFCASPSPWVSDVPCPLPETP